MEVIAVLIPLALLLGGFFVAAFLWSARSGQYDDLETPRHRILLDETQVPSTLIKKKEE